MNAAACPYSGKVAAAKMFGLRNDSYIRHWEPNAAPATLTTSAPTAATASPAAGTQLLNEDKQRIEKLEKELQEARTVITQLRSELDRLARWQH